MVEIDDDTPIRLSEAARRCFPDGSMSASGLRRLGDKGLLTIERINRAIIDHQRGKEMRGKCCVAPKARGCGSAAHAITVTPEHSAAYIILDKRRQISTGCTAGDADEAKKALAAYIQQKHQRQAGLQDPAEFRSLTFSTSI